MLAFLFNVVMIILPFRSCRIEPVICAKNLDLSHCGLFSFVLDIASVDTAPVVFEFVGAAYNHIHDSYVPLFDRQSHEQILQVTFSLPMIGSSSLLQDV